MRSPGLIDNTIEFQGSAQQSMVSLSMPSLDPNKPTIDDPNWLLQELGLKRIEKITNERKVCAWFLALLGTSIVIIVFIVIPSGSLVLFLFVIIGCLAGGIGLLSAGMKTSGMNVFRAIRFSDFQLSTGDARAAIEHLKHAIAVDPAHVPSRTKLAQACQRTGDINLAVKIVDELVLSNPTSRDFIWMLDEMLQDANDTRRAINTWESHLESVDKLSKEHDGEPGTRPILKAASALMLDRLGSWYVAQHQVSDAERCFEKSIRSFPGDNPAWLGLVRILIDRHDYVNAINLMQEAYDAVPGYDVAVLFIAECHFKMNEPEKAYTVLNGLIAKNPLAPNIWVNMGFVYSTAGLHERALAAVLKAKQLDPKSPHAWANHGVILVNLDRYDEAIGVATAGLQYQDSILSAVSYTAIGDANYRKNRLDIARVSYEKALLRNGKNVDAHLGMLAIHLRNGEIDKARVKIADIKVFEPDSYVLAYACTLCLVAGGKKDEAISYLQDAVKKNPALKSDLVKEPLLDPIKNDPRFIAILKG
jgi:tetratricopeptide (TPR) repeat protein